MKWRGRAIVAALALSALLAAGCGQKDFANDPRPPYPAEVTVNINDRQVDVSPTGFGAGLVNFTIGNQTREWATLTVSGPTSAQSGEIPPAGNGTLKVDMKTGTYELGAHGPAARPFALEVGPERPSASNDLLLP
jgi:hypothetical protein